MKMQYYTLFILCFLLHIPFVNSTERHAVLIGRSEYSPLKGPYGPINDVASLKDILIRQHSPRQIRNG
jgi:hypothetical protein